VTDDNRSWPNQEPDAPRRAQWPGEDAGPAWPGESPRRATPPRGNPRQGGPAWPAGDEGGQQWPGDQPRRPQAPRGQGGASGRRQPPPTGRRPGGPPGSPPQGFRQPPAAGRRPEPEPEREPDLITHHAHNGTEDGYDPYDDDRFDEFADDVEPQQELDEKGRKVLTPAQKKKRRWKIIRRVAYACVGVFFVVPAIAFVITYFMVDVPTPESVAALQSQPITYYYSDGSVMGKSTKGGDRQLLKPGEIPDVVKHAVYSAEDATFETNSGFDFTGILRAVFNQATGGQGGGSTISQQYIKQATQNDAPTLTRKWTELAKSFKMNNQESKEEIITGYLNIVYFGRGASGIQAAAKAYFGKDAKDLSPSEAALLAGLIQGPGKSENQDYAQRRWTYVMDQMVANKWLRADERATAQFPTPIAKTSKDSGQSMSYHIQQRIDQELADDGYDSAKLHASGAKVYTTIDPKAQKAAEDAVANKMKNQSDDRLLSALVAVSPKTGGVLAYYGGPDLVKNAEGKDQTGQDRANQARNPGSSFKAFDLTAYLKMGKGLGDIFDGSNNRKFGDPPKTIRNAGESSSCGTQCTVATAMEISANTVFYDMVYNITKPARVAQAANEAGVPTSSQMTQDINIALGGGATVATPEAMAAGYATFAGDGMHRDAHFVAKLTNAQDEVEFDESKYQAKPAFDGDAQKTAQIAGNVTMALGPVIKHSNLECPAGHQCAGKTGTQQYDPRDGDPAAYKDRNAQTWMVGYTPSVSAAVWVGGDGNIPLHDNKNKPIFGSTISGPIWQDFMKNYLNGTPGEKFDKVDPIGKDANEVSTTQSKPSDTPTPTDTPTSTPTEPSTETPTESESSTSRTTRTSRPGPGGPTVPLPGGDGFARPPGSERE